MPARSTLWASADGSLLLGNSWRIGPLAVLDNWSKWLTLELKMLSLGLWSFGGDMSTVLQAFREERAGEEQSKGR